MILRIRIMNHRRDINVEAFVEIPFSFSKRAVKKSRPIFGNKKAVTLRTSDPLQ